MYGVHHWRLQQLYVNSYRCFPHVLCIQRNESAKENCIRGGERLQHVYMGLSCNKQLINLMSWLRSYVYKLHPGLKGKLHR